MTKRVITSEPLSLRASVLKHPGDGLGSFITDTQRHRDTEPGKISEPLSLRASVLKRHGDGLGSFITETQRHRDTEPGKISEPLSLSASVLKHNTGFGERSVS